MQQGNALRQIGREVLYIIAFVVFITVGLSGHAAAQQEIRVEETAAHVQGTRAIPSIVRARMERTVAAIAAERMEGRCSADIDAAEEEQIIGAVFDRLLVGYMVTEVRVVPGACTSVDIHLTPWADTVESVSLTMTVEGMPPEVETLVRADLAGAQQVFTDALVGLPLAATDWAAGALKRELTAYMEAHLPEFRADYDISVDTAAQVHLMVYPRLPVVRTVDLSMRSDTIPNVTLLTRRSVLETETNHLIGVPVAFISRHRMAFEERLAKTLDAGSGFRRLHLSSHVTLTPDERMHVMSRTDTTRYRLRLTGWLDLGRGRSAQGDERRDMIFRLHAGRMLDPRDELYIEADAAPEDLRMDWRIGFARELFPHMRGELRYDLQKDRFSFAGTYALHSRWLIRYEHMAREGRGEWELRYKLHDFLSLAGLTNGDDAWLRLIGNF